MDFWDFVLYAVWVFGIGLLFWIVYHVVTTTKRHELEAAADLEYEELKSQEGYVGVSFLRGNRGGTEADRKARERRSTETGKELMRLEEQGKWFFFLGAIVAIICLIVYLKT
ncbi:hypothetical protein IKG20_03380 [Candidatus Saccharibacteria bacterium]|nr:hypothetical protein [Candidatus Saccharibacteria bacterium]